MNDRKEIDKFLSAIVLFSLGLVWLVQFIMGVAGAAQSIVNIIGIIRHVLLGLTYLVLLYNALGYSKNIVFRIIVIAVAVWLIFSLVCIYIPGLNIPYTMV